jgi:TPR repeat protein/tRNA A-37 threonylcarbamoyl transferase component Bud32
VNERRPAPAFLAELAGRFEVQGTLGKGGMATVYRARERESGREVALKILSEERSKPEQMERFLREGQVTAGLRHPGIVRVHDAGACAGRGYLVYELVEGARTLDVVLPQLDVRERVALVRDAARALGFAHAQGVLHRDVKPENLLVDGAGHLRVADFGLARGAAQQRLTRTGALLGTPHYMAPELVAGERERQGPATDVWALGVILYQAITGSLPFEGQGFLELSAAIIHAEPTPPSQRAPGVDRGLEAVCLRALAPQPEGRYADGAALANDLDRVLQGEVPAALDGARGRALLVVPLTLLAVIGVAFAAALQQAPRPRSQPATTGADAVAVTSRGPAEVATPATSPEEHVAESEASQPPPVFPQLDPEEAQAHVRALARQEGLDLLRSIVGTVEEDPAQAYHLFGVGYERAQLGFPADPQRALYWHHRAAQAGHLDSMRILAHLLIEQEGCTPAQGLEAKRLLERSLELGVSEPGNSLEGLAKIYRDGLGVPRDLAKAWELRLEAVRVGPPPTAPDFQVWIRSVVWAEVRTPEQVLDELTPALESGDPDAHFSVAMMHMQAGWSTLDPAAARTHLERAAQLGIGEALLEVARRLESGEGLEQDLPAAKEWQARAVAWLEEEIRLGTARAHLAYARLLRAGDFGLVQDRERAWYHLRVAIDSGSGEAAEEGALWEAEEAE